MIESEKMITLCIRTDKPLAEIYIYQGEDQLGKQLWEAHRKLADTLHVQIGNLLEETNKKLSDINKIVVFKGPGSFTGLRIGLSVANTLAYGLDIAVVGTEGDEWIIRGLSEAEMKKLSVQPVYGSDPHITKQKK